MTKITVFLGIATVVLSANACFPQSAFNVRDYGASGNRADIATKAIQQTIDTVHARGGGVVLLPAGDYLSGTLVLKSNVTLRLDPGATLYASQDTADYRVPFNIYKNNNPRQPVLLYAEGARNISIEGQGRIHGQARRVYRDLGSADGFIAEETEIARQAGVAMKMYRKVPPFVSLIYLVSCQDVTIEDVRIIESVDWTLHVQWCARVNIRNCFIQSSREAGVNADGIDVDGCRDVTVSDCVIATGDDAIVLKSTLTNGRYEDCANVTVTNCVLTSTSSALKIGTETYGDFRHIVFTNCVISNSNRGLGIIVRDGGRVSDVIVSNITMELNRKHFNWWGSADPFWLVVLKRQEDSKVGSIENVLLSNIIAHGQGTSKITGLRPETIRNVSLDAVQLFMQPEGKPDKRATHALEIANANDLTIIRMRVRWDKTVEEKWQSALAVANVRGLTIDGFRGRAGGASAAYPVITLHNVQDVDVRGVEPISPTGVLIRVSGEQTQDTHFFNNDRRQRAQQQVVRTP
ncbi:MAG: glycoside hydrolase family 28 protein [Tunicatimonas sp.]